MALAGIERNERSETTHSTKQVFMRAEHKDIISISDVLSNQNDEPLPGTYSVISRDLTYHGPSIRIEDIDTNEQFKLTAPGPKSEAIFWRFTENGWRQTAEVCLEFHDSLPQYDICLYCNEPIASVEHRRRSVIGACNNC